MPDSNAQSEELISVVQEFLSQAFPNAEIVLAAIPQEGGPPECRIFNTNDPGWESWIEERNGQCNLYYTPNRCQLGARGKPSEADVLAFRAVGWADIDCDKSKPLVEELKRLGSLAGTLMACSMPPSALVMTGGGLQPLWLLENEVVLPTDPKQRAAVLNTWKNGNRRIHEVLGADATFNADRLLRLPGTVNLPNAAKRAHGRTPVEAAVWHSGRRYTLQDAKPIVRTLETEIVPTGLVTPRKPAPNATDTVKDDANRIAKLQQEILDSGVLSEIQRPDEYRVAFENARDLDAMFAKRWGGSTEGLNDVSRSGRDISIAAFLSLWNWVPLDIARALLDFPHGGARDTTKRPTTEAQARYIARCIAKSGGDPSGENAESTRLDEDAIIDHVKAEISKATENDGEITMARVHKLIEWTVSQRAYPPTRDIVVGLLADSRKHLRIQSVRDTMDAALKRRPISSDEQSGESDEANGEAELDAAELLQKCQSLAETRDFVGELSNVAKRSGIVGEHEALLLVYLSATSRLFTKPANPLIKGPSSSGKSTVADCALGLIPPEAKKEITLGSAKSLIYSDFEPAHKVLYIFEATPLQQDDNSEYAYILRTLISEGRIRYETVVEDLSHPNRRSTVTIEKDGPVSVVITTTAESLHTENETRMISLSVNSSRNQTVEVLKQIGSRKDNLPEEERERWWSLQRWVASNKAAVVIPYALLLSRMIDPVDVRLRRDFDALLSLIAAHALLQQLRRRRDSEGRIIANLRDYRVVREVMSRAVDVATGSAPSQTVVQVVDTVRDLIAGKRTRSGGPGFTLVPFTDANGNPDHRVRISYRALGHYAGIDHKAAQRGLWGAVDAGYLVRFETPGRNTANEYGIDKPLPVAGGAGSVFPTVAELVAKLRWLPRGLRRQLPVAARVIE